MDTISESCVESGILLFDFDLERKTEWIHMDKYDKCMTMMMSISIHSFDGLNFSVSPLILVFTSHHTYCHGRFRNTINVRAEC